MPITTPADRLERYGGDRHHFEHVLEHLFVPAVEQAGFDAVRPSAQGADMIQAEIVRNLETADLVLCDISTLNANVFFELGIRTALDRPVCLVRDEHTATIPFDTGMINCLAYDSQLRPWNVEAQITALADHLKASADRAEGRNALWRYFGLTQRGHDAIEATSDDPQQSALKVVLDELRQLRGEFAAASAAPPASHGTGQSTTERWFFRTADEIASENGARLRVIDRRSASYVVFEVLGAALTDEQTRRILAAGEVAEIMVGITYP